MCFQPDVCDTLIFIQIGAKRLSIVNGRMDCLNEFDAFCHRMLLVATLCRKQRTKHIFLYNKFTTTDKYIIIPKTSRDYDLQGLCRYVDIKLTLSHPP